MRFHQADKIDGISDESDCIKMNLTLSELEIKLIIGTYKNKQVKKSSINFKENKNISGNIKSN